MLLAKNESIFTDAMNLSRRSFLKTVGVAAITAPFFTRNLLSAAPSERVRFAAFGSANMARADINSIISHPNVDFVAVADVDAGYLAGIKKEKNKKTSKGYLKRVKKKTKRSLVKSNRRLRSNRGS